MNDLNRLILDNKNSPTIALRGAFKYSKVEKNWKKCPNSLTSPPPKPVLEPIGNLNSFIQWSLKY